MKTKTLRLTDFHSNSIIGCPREFSSAVMLYCHGTCGNKWLDNEEGCQKSDADAYCKLKLCREGAFANSFNISTSDALPNQPGFACRGSGTNYGNWVGMTDVNFRSELSNHGLGGKVVTNVTCKTLGKFCNALLEDRNKSLYRRTTYKVAKFVIK